MNTGIASAVGHPLFRRWKRLALCAAFALVASVAAAERLVGAHYEAPVDRYGHFALGRPHEYARVTATTDTGRKVALQLPEHEVFEDLAPRIVRMAEGEPEELLAVVSGRDSGSRLMLIRLRGGGLEASAQSRPIGTPNRWLNPVGVADLDGDGRAEIAAVITPHIGGTLKVYRKQGGELAEVAALHGFSNHVYGTAELGLSAIVQFGGRTHLLVPDAARRQLRVIGMDRGGLIDVGRCPLTAPVTGGVTVISSSEVSVRLLAGRQVIGLDACLR